MEGQAVSLLFISLQYMGLTCVPSLVLWGFKGHHLHAHGGEPGDKASELSMCIR